MAKTQPLTPTEDAFWRALMRIVLSLPRHLHNDLLRATGLTASDYKVLMNLSEAADRTLRMADLAIATGLSASRTSRVVDDLQARGFVTKRTNSNDGRSNLAKLTAKGLTELKSAWPVHLASVRRRVFDHIDRSAVSRAAQTLSAVAAALEKEDTGRA